MINGLTHNRKQKFLELVVLLICLMLYTVLSTFWHHQYPIVSPEFVLFVLAAIILSSVISAALMVCRCLIVNFLLVLVIAIVFMIQFNVLLEGLVLTLLGSCVLAMILGKAFPKLLIPVVLALILGSYLDSMFDRKANLTVADIEEPDPALPPIVHIILDQFIGLDGLPPQKPAQMFRSETMKFMQENGFQVYSKAYSNYINTEDSLDRAFNFRNDPRRVENFSSLLLKNFEFQSNAYLSTMQEQGYAVRIYQSEGMGFCNSPASRPEKCWTYHIPDLVSIYYGYESAFERTQMITRLLLSQSRLLNKIAEGKGWAKLSGFSFFKREIFDEMSDDMKINPNGRIYFAHVLLPHSPYVYLGDCSLNYGSEKQWRFASHRTIPNNTPETRGIRYVLYLEQARCTLKLLNDFFDGMRAKGIFDQSIILLHGDHGSTIYERDPSIVNEPTLTSTDLLDAYSTLFAVKMPNGEFRINDETVSLAVLIHRFASKLTSGTHATPDEKPFIYLKEGMELKRVDIDIFADFTN